MLNSKKITLHYLTPEHSTPSKPTQTSFQAKQRYSHPTNQSFTSIDPTWHLIASMQTVLTPKIKAKSKYFFSSLQGYSKNIEQAFINHCATTIQKNFRGYMQRKYYRKFLPVYRRVRNLLEAVSAGWRVRRILELKGVKKRIKQIKQAQSRNEEKRLRILKRDFSYEMRQLQKKGKWIQMLKLQKGSLNKKSTQNKSIRKQINLKEAFNKNKQFPRSKQNLAIEQESNHDSRISSNMITKSEISRARDEQPIAAKGFYELPANQLALSGMKEKPKTQRNIEKTKKAIKKPYKKSNQKQVELPQKKKPSKMHETAKQDQEQTKIAKFDCSLLTIHLTEEEEQIMPENSMKFNNRKLSLKTGETPLANETPKNSKFKNQRKKNVARGLTVTLANSKVEHVKESRIQAFNFVDPLSVSMKSSRPRINSVDFCGKSKISREQIQKYGEQTGIRELLEAYVGPYGEKKIQIFEKLVKIESQDKFRKGLKFS